MPGKTRSLQIRDLWRGATSQSPWARLEGQVESAKNVRFDVTLNGAIKRGPTRYVTKLEGDSSIGELDDADDYYWSSIRGAIIAIGDGVVVGWDSDGNKLDVVDETSGSFYTYITTGDPVTLIETATSIDTMVVTNRSIAPRFGKAWSFETSYNYLVNGVATNPNTPVTTYKGVVEDFGELPPADGQADPINGDIWRTRNDYEADPSSFYVYYDQRPHADFIDGYLPEHSGNWWRIPRGDPDDTEAEGQFAARYIPSTMPHRIVYDESAGTLTLSECPWKQRMSGGRATNPQKPWAINEGAADRGYRIKDVEFHSDRLFPVSQGFNTSGRSNDFYNLWVDNVNVRSDADPIVTSISQSNVGEALRVASIGNSLLIVCENGQLDFGSGEDVLTNVNGRTRRVGEFQAVDIPLGVGPASVVMVDQFQDVHQYRWMGELQGIVYSSLLTAHKRDALYGVTPERVFSIDNTVYITVAKPGLMRTHDTFTIGNEMVQSAWNEMEFADHVAYVNAWGGYIDVVTRGNDGYFLYHYIHRDEEPPDDLLWMPSMDHLEHISPSEMTYDSDTDRTTMYHAGRDGDLASSMLVTTTEDKSHIFRPAVSVDSDGAVTFAGDWTDTEQWLGFLWDTELELSRLYPAMLGLPFAVTRLVMFHQNTAEYTVEWTKRDGQTLVEDKWQAVRLGETLLGAAVLETHYHETSPTGGMDSKTSVTYKSRSPGPVRWTGLEIEYIEFGRGASS